MIHQHQVYIRLKHSLARMQDVRELFNHKDVLEAKNQIQYNLRHMEETIALVKEFIK